MQALRILVLIFLAGVGVAASGAAAPAAPPVCPPATLVLPVSWSEFRGSFDGALTVNRFAGDTGVLLADGTLDGKTNSRYGPELVDQPASVPVLTLAVTGHVIHLTLGPLDPRPPSGVGLHLDRFAVDLTAQPLTATARVEMRRLAAAISSGAPATALAVHLNRLLPVLVDLGVATAGPNPR